MSSAFLLLPVFLAPFVFLFHPRLDRRGYTLYMWEMDEIKAVKLGLYLQGRPDESLHGGFDRAMDAVRNSDIDILVLPEFSHVPFEEEFHKADLLDKHALESIYEKTLEFSRSLGRAVVICNNDRKGMIVCIWANAFAQEGETPCKKYIKHTMTGWSACQLDDYPAYAEEAFTPILFRGHKIGMTACYDCNHAMFSRKYGLNGADILVNCTGGDVEKDKWYKYNKIRAMENSCFNVVTMGHMWQKDGSKSGNYVFGFTPTGKEMVPVLLNGDDRGRRNFPDGVYVYDTAQDDGQLEVDPSAHQQENPSKDEDISIPTDGIMDFYMEGREVKAGLRVRPCGKKNLVMCLIEGEDILKPESVLKLLYAREIADLRDKKYLIINRWGTVDMDFYEKQLSLILKVHTMQNFSAVILTSDNMAKCFQASDCKNAQVIPAVDGKLGLALGRMGGPETIWKNHTYEVKGTLETYMKKAWRKNVEWLVESL